MLFLKLACRCSLGLLGRAILLGWLLALALASDSLLRAQVAADPPTTDPAIRDPSPSLPGAILPEESSRAGGDNRALTTTGDASPINERQPRIYYSRDKDGKLWPLVNIPWERIQALLDADDTGEANPPAPRFQISQLNLQGVVNDQRVELSAEIQVTLPEPLSASGDANPTSSWTLIPLRFPEAALLEQPEHEGPGRLFVLFREPDGYQAWILHDQGGEHKIKLRLATPLDESAGSSRLRILPPNATQSNLSLEVPGVGLSAEADSGRRVTVTTTAEDRSRLNVTDLRNQLTLSWRAGREVVAERPTNFDVKGDIRVSIDSPGAIRSQVTLDLQSYGRPIERFSLRLPPQTAIVSGNQAGFELREIPAETGTDAAEARSTVEVVLQKPSTQARLQLTTQTSDPEVAGPYPVGNFEVAGAIRQSGQITLLASEDWRVDWNLGSSVRRIVNPESFESSDERRPLATFQYFRQPCQLEVQARQQETRISVRPSYRMHVSEDRVTLETQFDYKLRGARLSLLNFELNGWTLDDAGPSSTVESDDLQLGNVDQAKLRLRRPTSGDLSLNLTLHRPITEPRSTLRLPLPWPIADDLIPGSMTVTTADAVVVDFKMADMTSLVPDLQRAADATSSVGSSTANAPALTSTGSEPRVPGTTFRFLSDRDPGQIVMDYQIRAQEIRVRMDSELEAEGDAIQVAQHLSYRILYRPTSQLTLDVPRPLFELLSNPRYRPLVELRLDGQLLGRESFEDVADSVDALRNIVPVNIPLGRPRLGTLDLFLRFPWTLRVANSSDPQSIPLTTPRDGRLMSNIATLNASGAFRLEPTRELGWTRESNLIGALNPTAIQLSSTQRANSLRLLVTPLQNPENTADEQNSVSTTVIQRAWMQTWLTRNQQHDRAVMRLATMTERLRVRVPVSVTSVSALVDGVGVPAVRNDLDATEWTIPLSRAQSGEHTLELFMTHTRRPQAGAMRFAWPTLSEATTPRRWFWQLVVPRDEHLWSSDPQLSVAHRWALEGWLMRREDAQSQPSLEEWTGASTQPPLPPGVNSYLFSSFGRTDPFQVRTMGRRTLVYGFSLLALAIACGLVYLPIVRHPATLMSLGVFLAGSAWFYSDLIWLVLQAGLLGLVLAGITLLISRLGSAREASTHPWIPRAPDGRGATPPQRRDGSSPPTTITVPGNAMPSIAPDSKV